MCRIGIKSFLQSRAHYSILLTNLVQERGMDEFAKMLKENVVLPLWPETGRVLGLSRGATYAAAKTGDIKTIRLGRLLKVPCGWLRQKLEIGPGSPGG
jgi:hypothetical protein